MEIPLINRLALLIPPPIVMLLTGFMMWLLTLWIPAAHLTWPSRTMTAGLIATLGVIVALAGMFPFMRARTTMDPKRPANASTLIRSGIYRYSRNPMYLGVLLMLTGWAVYLQNGMSFLGLPVFMVYMTYFQIIPEERTLLEKFGEEFQNYMQDVRRWL